MKTQFSLLFIAAMLFCGLHVFAQDIQVDKSSGLVRVDGQNAFYLKGTNKVLWQKDFSLTNLDGEELAYLKAEQGEKWNNTTRQYENETFYGVTFSKSGNYCQIHGFTSLSVMKSLAKAIVAARLVQNGQISPDAEQKFIVMHNGTFLRNPNATPAVVVNVPAGQNTAPARPVRPADISLDGEKIYNHDQLIATFRKTDKDGTTQVSIFDLQDAMLATAFRGPNAEWTVNGNADGISRHYRYHADNPLVKLFAALVAQGILPD